MSTNSTDLFSYLPGLEATENELLESELLAQQILTAKYPDLDLREGTALRDLSIRPNANLLTLINKALVFYFQSNTLSDVDDSTAQVFVDKLMSNWFLTRKAGLQAIINARLYFAKAKSVNIYTDVFFSTDGTLKFFPITSVTYASTDLTFESSSNQYYIDVDLIAESPGSAYNVTTGSLLYFSNFDPYFLRAEINYLRSTAQDVETNTQFIARASTAISTRNNINVPSISTNLLNTFSDLTEIKPIGMGDPEMARDQLLVTVPGVTSPVWIHNGGKTDVYCKAAIASSITQFTADSTGKFAMTGSIYNFARSLVSGGAASDTMDPAATFTWANTYIKATTPTSITSAAGVATVTIPNHGLMTGQRITISGAAQTQYNGTFVIASTPDANTLTYVVATGITSPATGTISVQYVDPLNEVGFTERQSLTFDFGIGNAGKTVSFTIYYHDNLQNIQSYLDSAANRVICADTLARGFNLALLDVVVTGYNGPAPDADTCNTACIEYVNSLLAGEPFVMSDLVSHLYAHGITTIQTPVTVNCTKYWKDKLGSSPVLTITDVFNPHDSLNQFVVNSVTTANEAIV